MGDAKPEECPECGAITERMLKHRRWHEKLEGRLQALDRDADTAFGSFWRRR